MRGSTQGSMYEWQGGAGGWEGARRGGAPIAQATATAAASARLMIPLIWSPWPAARAAPPQAHDYYCSGARSFADATTRERRGECLPTRSLYWPPVPSFDR